MAGVEARKSLKFIKSVVNNVAILPRNVLHHMVRKDFLLLLRVIGSTYDERDITDFIDHQWRQVIDFNVKHVAHHVFLLLLRSEMNWNEIFERKWNLMGSDVLLIHPRDDKSCIKEDSLISFITNLQCICGLKEHWRETPTS